MRHQDDQDDDQDADNDDALVGQIYTRREALRATAWAGLGVMAAGLLSPAARAAYAGAARLPTTRPRVPLVASPTMTEGPFFVDEKLNRSDLLAGTTRPSVVGGLPLTIAFTVWKLEKDKYAPMPGVQVDVWHADAAGVYSDESNPMNHEDSSGQTWLRGFQRTDADGVATFSTIFPGWYEGRAPHVHFKVRQAAANTNPNDGKLATAEFSSQLFFTDADADRIYSKAPYKATRGPRDTRNSDDDIYGERRSDGTAVGDAMLLDLTPAADGKGYTALFPVLLTDGSFQSGRGGMGGPGGRGGPPGGPGGFGPPPGGPGGPGGPPPMEWYGGPTW